MRKDFPKTTFQALNLGVISPGYCIGCGICVAVCPHNYLSIEENEYGELLPVCEEKCDKPCKLCSAVCPFFPNEEDETTLANELFVRDENTSSDPVLGVFQATYVGHVCDSEAREASPSGGLTHAVLKWLLESGQVDAVLAPKPVEGRPWFDMHVHSTPQSIESSRGSVYHVLSWDEVIRSVLQDGEKRYAVVGLPCVVKALRLAQKRIPKLRRRITHVLGLTCGTCKTRVFPDVLAHYARTKPKTMCYRSKKRARTATGFSFSFDHDDSRSARLPFQGVAGFLWVNGYAQPKACRFCDDAFAETADAAFMDAWLPEYIVDRKGTSLVICRTAEMTTLIQKMILAGRVTCETIPPQRVIESQAGMLRRKRGSLSGRLQEAREAGDVVPSKRQSLLEPVRPASRSEAARESAAWRDRREYAMRYHRRIALHQTERFANTPVTWLHFVGYL